MVRALSWFNSVVTFKRDDLRRPDGHWPLGCGAPAAVVAALAPLKLIPLPMALAGAAIEGGWGSRGAHSGSRGAAIGSRGAAIGSRGASLGHDRRLGGAGAAASVATLHTALAEDNVSDPIRPRRDPRRVILAQPPWRRWVGRQSGRVHGCCSVGWDWGRGRAHQGSHSTASSIKQSILISRQTTGVSAGPSTRTLPQHHWP
jgi:hypothetical protein